MENVVMEDDKQSVTVYPKYYYQSDDIIGNIYTVCILVDRTSGKILSRGIAIRSLLDMHKKATARNIAHGRAIKALVNEENSDEINVDRQKVPSFIMFKKRDGLSEDTIKKISESFFVPEGSSNIYVPRFYPLEVTAEEFKFKSEFMPEPTEKEKQIASKIPKVK
jgi:hypothetical protein